MLRGLFTADGTVVDSGDKAQYVGLDSTSLELLIQVQRMLLGFGIKSKLYSDRRGGRFTALMPDGKGGTKEYPVQEMHALRITPILPGPVRAADRVRAREQQGRRAAAAEPAGLHLPGRDAR